MKLMVIDGNSILNRAFYGIRPLTAADGLNTNAVYGFLMILNKLLKDEEPDALCVAFDLKAPTFRHKLYEGYKAARKAMPDELAKQIPYLRQVLDAMNIPCYELPGYEADDLIGTISSKCVKEGWDCLIVTGDRDSLQLIGDRVQVKLITTRMGKTDSTTYDTEAFSAQYGFEPINLIDLKALMGDSSDSIPGVKGVGEKTASALIRKYRVLDTVYSSLDEPDIKPVLRKKLEEGRDIAYLSYTLAAIDRDAPLEFEPHKNVRVSPDNNALYEIFIRLEFSKLIETFGLRAPGITGTVKKTEVNWQDTFEADKLIELCKNAEFVSFTASCELDALALICGGTGYAFSYRDMEAEAYKAFLKAFFSGEVKKHVHGAKRVMNALLKQGIPFGGFVFDAELAAYVLDPNEGGYAPQKTAPRLLSMTLPDPVFDDDSIFDMLGGGSDALDAMKQYAEAVLALYEYTAPVLAAQGTDRLLYELEMPLCPVLAKMEHRGFLVDKAALHSFSETLGNAIDILQNDIYTLSGENFNINSTKQLAEILFDKLNLPPASKTKTGNSTSIEVLEKLRDKHPIIEKLIDYRKLTKLKSTYADGLLKVISEDGRIHTSFNMTATATGRLSSTEPNLQNIPVRSELGGELRKMFIAEPGMALIDADYSQIELRVLAHISGDKVMASAFESGEDIHRVTASQVFNVPPDEVTGEMRSRAKAVNFGIVYGISDFSLAQDIKVSRSQAKAYITSYLEKYSGVRQYMTEIVERAKADGYVSTIFGRRRYLPELRSGNHNTRAFGERVALNMPIQGSAADIMKLAMINVDRRFKTEGLAARILLQVHDELIAEALEHEAALVASILTQEMQNAVKLSVPLIAEAHISSNWYDAK